MNKYSAKHDGMQWVVSVEYDKKVKDGEETTRAVKAIAYYPKFEQALFFIYQKMVGDCIGSFNQDEILAAVEKAQSIAKDILAYKEVAQ